MIEKIYTKKSIDRIKKKTLLMGVSNNVDPIKFMSIRLITSILIFICLLFTNYGYILSPIVTVIYYIGIEYLELDLPIKKRTSRLEKDALFFFEVLSLSLETGRNLTVALDLTVKNIDSELSKEFKLALESNNYGKTLQESLRDMKKRIPSDTINNVILNITHSNVYGSEIVDTLYNQVDYLRNKKVLEAKAVISKMPIKMSVVSVVFFIPIILLLILGPLLLELL